MPPSHRNIDDSSDINRDINTDINTNINSDMNKHQKRLRGMIVAILCTDLLCSGIYLPLLPTIAERRFGATATMNGILIGAYSFAQFLTAPLLGRMSDLYGRKRIFTLSLFGIALNYFLLSQASSIEMLFASRVIAGMLGANLSIAQAYLADLSSTSERTASMSYTGGAFAFGFTVGPIVGGILSSADAYDQPARIAFILSLINVVICLAIPEIQTKSALKTEKIDGSLLLVVSDKGIRSCLLLRLFFSLAFITFRTCLPILLSSPMGYNVRQKGYVLSYVALLAGAAQGGLMKSLSKKYTDTQLVQASLVTLTVSLACWSVVTSTVALTIVLIPLCFSIGIITTCSSSYLTKIVPPNQSGYILGWCASIDSAAKFVSPMVGGFLIDTLGSSSPGLLGSAMCAISYLISLDVAVLTKSKQL